MIQSTVQLHKTMNHNIKATSCPLCPHLNISEVQKHILTVHSLELDYENVNIAVEAKQSNDLMEENLEGDVSLHSSHSGISSSDHRETYQQKDKQLPLELVNNNKLDKRESFVQCDLLGHKKADYPAYICKICGNTFKGHSQLSAHKRLHKERRFKCANCDKSYPRQTDLNIHMHSHTGDRPYVCHICDKRFPVKVRLTYHLQRHQGVRHSCPYCDVVYENRNQLKSNLFKHTGMLYRCDDECRRRG
uniref:C2H2-type domain-containing protein n=1 Tax=Glossina pallidipes TaxID=7398 RepID=A0A1A9ZQ57_GLOPL